VLHYEIGDDLLIGFKSLDGGGLVILHQAAVTGDIGTEDGGEFAMEAFWFHADTSLSRRFGNYRIRRGKSESKRRWKGGEMRTTQPNQRPLQVRCNGKDARAGGKYTSGRGKKSNVIGSAAESISQNDALCDLSMKFQAPNNPKS